jgi:hypothetical protein
VCVIATYIIRLLNLVFVLFLEVRESPIDQSVKLDAFRPERMRKGNQMGAED